MGFWVNLDIRWTKQRRDGRTERKKTRKEKTMATGSRVSQAENQAVDSDSDDEEEGQRVMID
jgi:ribosome assembly protein YihI (activator of Der GTPase)